jgi:hypothetical protein
MNLAEIWLGLIERQTVRRGTFRSVKDLNPEIRVFINNWNDDRAYPFIWTKTANEILVKVNRQSTSKPDH